VKKLKFWSLWVVSYAVAYVADTTAAWDDKLYRKVHKLVEDEK
jgi:hypothetical protein